MFVTGDKVAEYVGRKTNSFLVPPYTCLGIERGGDIVAGVVFNVYTGSDAHITVASERGAMTRRFLKSCAYYAVKQMGVERVTIVTEQDDVVEYALRLGAKVEGRLRSHFGKGRDATILGILKAEAAQTLFGAVVGPD